MIIIFTNRDLKILSKNKYITEVELDDFVSYSLEPITFADLVIYTDFLSVKILKNKHDSNYFTLLYENLCDFLEKYKKDYKIKKEKNYKTNK